MTILDVWQQWVTVIFPNTTFLGLYTQLDTKYFFYLEDSLMVDFPQQHLLSAF